MWLYSLELSLKGLRVKSHIRILKEVEETKVKTELAMGLASEMWA